MGAAKSLGRVWLGGGFGHRSGQGGLHEDLALLLAGAATAAATPRTPGIPHPAA